MRNLKIAASELLSFPNTMRHVMRQKPHIVC